MSEQSGEQYPRLARNRHSERGVSTVEFAALFPVFMMLVLATFDFGRAYFEQHVLLEAAQVAARVGTLPDKSNSEVVAAAREVLESAGITVDESNVYTSNAGSNGESGDITTVEVEYDFKPVVGQLFSTWGEAFTLSKVVKMRHE